MVQGGRKGGRIVYEQGIHSHYHAGINPAQVHHIEKEDFIKMKKKYLEEQEELYVKAYDLEEERKKEELIASEKAKRKADEEAKKKADELINQKFPTGPKL